ncbi:AMP-binding protein [Streptomyces pinistramenti]|uniref:AMP-binding protein n=1 Tax=Streptomyces pinistramenti TaxID=2884812 RepID=UPI001D06A881|nr:AMP-binding protein [Streptomyces pinistramenti]MCB5910301.1 AMP-binding protein [Streptomyces pinistramenti]
MAANGTEDNGEFGRTADTATAPATVAALVTAQWGDHRVGVRSAEGDLTHHQLAAGAAARAALLCDLLPRGAEPHVGVLLDNVPEYPLWISAAALAGAAVVGINPTRRGPELARDIVHTGCALLITERAHLPLLDGLELPLPPERILVVDDPAYRSRLEPYAAARPGEARIGVPAPASRLLLSFTSGSTGAPKAALCTQGRLAAAGHALARYFTVCRDDVHYLCMPMFHGNAVFAGWAPALAGGAAVALRRRFSASAFLPDVRRYRATYFTYVGRAVQYLLATPPGPDDRDHTLRAGFGTEAGAVDAARFAERFGVRLVEGYGSSEGGAALQRSPGTPPGAIGRAAPGDDLAVVDRETGAELPRARLDRDGRLLNGEAAIGELVNRGRSAFEGYWRNPEATAARTRAGSGTRPGAGWYWTGDLFFRDAAGFFHFAGRTDDRLRVDSENLAAAMIENILSRYEPARGVAVYAVPDPVAGDQVMAAVALPAPAAFDPEDFAAFLAAQPDLGTKMAPRFVRAMAELPVTATGKVHRVVLRRSGFRCVDPVWWTPLEAGPAGSGYRPFDTADRAALLALYRDRERNHLLDG